MSKLAFITGGAGFLGSQLCNILLESNFHVICFGRTLPEKLSNYTRKLIQGADYHAVDLKIDLQYVKNIISQNVNSKYDELYFFNLAWSGEDGLSDLNVSSQFMNIIFTQELYDLSDKLGFDCFIHSGTMEEKFAQKYTNLNFQVDNLYNRHVIYALAKLYSRYSLKLNSKSRTKIVINSNAHLIGPGDKKDSFLQQVIISHLENKDVNMSSGEQLFDVIHVLDCAKAYLLTARHGRGIDEFWIGSNAPRQLYQYVDDINLWFDRNVIVKRNAIPFNDVILDYSEFKADKLYCLGFEKSFSFKQSVSELAQHLSKRDN